MQRTRVVFEDTVDRFMSVCNYKIRANIPGVTGRTDVDVDNDTYWHIAVDDLGYGSASRLYNQLSSLGCVVALFFGDTLIAETAPSVPIVGVECRCEDRVACEARCKLQESDF